MNENFPSFKATLQHFLTSAGVTRPPITACFAVAGPVTNNRVSFTNRESWSIDGEDIAQSFGIRIVKLVNDFVAVGYGLLTLKEETECKVLQSAPKVSNAPIACIGAGTGLGECFLTVGPNGQYVCYPTEGGHTEFAPRSVVRLASILISPLNLTLSVSLSLCLSVSVSL
jgi:glucokinase